MNRSLTRIGTALAATIAAVTLSPLASPAQAAVSCTNNLSHEVDGTRGVVVLYPTVRCAGDTLTLTIDGFALVEDDPGPIVYKTRPAGTYSGYGVEIPNKGPGQYCAVVDAVWTNWGPDLDNGVVQQGEATSRHCVTI